MSETILAAAKELIKAKKYEEARTILLTIKNDPTAAKWLEKLNERIGEQTRQRLASGSSPSTANVPTGNVERRNYTIHPPVSTVSPTGKHFTPEELTRGQAVADAYVRQQSLKTQRHENVGMARIFRWIWGILLLLVILWMGNAFLSLGELTNESLQQAERSRNVEAAQAGTILGSGIGLTTILCFGLPFFIFFGLMYWRNGVAIREAKRHQQTIEAMRGR